MHLKSLTVLRLTFRKILVLALNRLGARRLVDVFFEAINLNSEKLFCYDVHVHNLNNTASLGVSMGKGRRSIIQELNTTVVMQGPIDHKSNFTLKTIMHYLNTYPSVNVILSTWNTEDLSKFTDLMKNSSIRPRFSIVQSQKPDRPGISNINMQIVSTQAGIQYAREKSTQYLLKTRTDQCLFSRHALQYMISLIDQYPVSKGGGRILSSSLGTFLLRPYGLSDMLTFGEFEVVSDYWNVELDWRTVKDLSFPEANTLRDEAVRGVCEIYLVKRHLEKLQVEVDNSLRQSLEIFRDYFVIADSQILEQVWNKYSYRRNKYYYLNSPMRHQELSHHIWRDLQDNISYYLRYESLLDKKGNF